MLTGYTAYLDELLCQGISNSAVCLERLQSIGYKGSLSTVKRYIQAHKYLIPAKRQLTVPQGNRGRRFISEPGDAYQMDWGFTKVLDYDGSEYTVACFAMICHHCGQQYIEFFPNAKQENLFIGMIHAFCYMGIPRCILTDNMKSVVLHRDFEGYPVWQKDYEVFMKTIGFQTKLCKPRHPFTKGKVERLVRFVKENFLVGRSFFNITDLNREALAWCEKQNNTYHRSIAGIPHEIHFHKCVRKIRPMEMTADFFIYLCPERRISFDGFVTYEGRRFGVPYWYTEKTCRVKRDGYVLYIYDSKMTKTLTTHDVTWSRRDSFCRDQYVSMQPEETPSTPVKVHINQISPPEYNQGFRKFNFEEGLE